MLDYVATLPEAKTWPAFSRWFGLVLHPDQQAMLDLLRGFAAEDRKQVLFFLRAMNGLGRQVQVWLQNDTRYKAPSSAQDDMLKLCRFVCYEDADIRKQYKDLEYALPSGAVVPEILAWHIPLWFNEVYAALLDGDVHYRFSFSYPQAIAMERLSGLPLPSSFVAPHLEGMVRRLRWRDELSGVLFDDYPEILGRDIWTLFTGKTMYHFGTPAREGLVYRAHNQYWDKGAVMPAEEYAELNRRLKAPVRSDDPEDVYDTLVLFFMDKTSDGTLDRMRALRECLIAPNRSLPPPQAGGYSVLFEALAPTEKELLDLQDDLWGVLNCPHAKALSAALRQLKRIASSPEFDLQAFQDILPVLLAHATKSVHTATLALAEAVAKADSARGKALLPALTAVFDQPDEATQKRAAKCITTYGSAGDPDLAEALGLHLSGMKASVRETLAPFLGHAKQGDRADTDIPSIEPVRHLVPEARVTLPATLDDLLFLLSTAFSQPEPYHSGLIPDALFAFREQIDEAFLGRLGPAAKAARTVLGTSDMRGQVHNRTLALHFVRYCIRGLERASGGDKGVKAMLKSLPDLQRATEFDYQMTQWDRYGKRYWFMTYKCFAQHFGNLNHIVGLAFARLESADPLPMLSHVTHAPCWIDPVILAERLRLWQAAGREPDSMDLQLALQRCVVEPSEAFTKALQQLDGEYRDVLSYLFGGPLPSKDHLTHPAWWVTAALSTGRPVPDELVRRGFQGIPPEYLQGIFEWEVVPFTPRRTDPAREFSTTATQAIRVRAARIKPNPEYLSQDAYKEPQVEGDWKNLFAGETLLADESSLLYQALDLYPNNPEPLMLDAVGGYGQHDPWLGIEYYRKLLGLRIPVDPPTALFLALGLLAGDRELRLHAAAFWQAKVNDGQVDSAAVGRCLGRLERHGWTPTKRFMDIVEKELLGISPLHDRHLCALLGGLLTEAGADTPVDLKKIMGVYYELLAAGHGTLDAACLQHLEVWKTGKYAAPAKRLLSIA